MEWGREKVNFFHTGAFSLDWAPLTYYIAHMTLCWGLSLDFLLKWSVYLSLCHYCWRLNESFQSFCNDCSREILTYSLHWYPSIQFSTFSCVRWFFFPPSFFRQSVLVHIEISGGGLLRFTHARRKIRGTFNLPCWR